MHHIKFSPDASVLSHAQSTAGPSAMMIHACNFQDIVKKTMHKITTHVRTSDIECHDDGALPSRSSI
jgi:hypothetical protein